MTEPSPASAATTAWSPETLSRVIAIANDKGGVGKTSLAAGLSALYAAAGYKVLAVDVNRQGNLAEDLGYAESAIDDEGKGLRRAIEDGDLLQPVPVPGRPGLDVIPGGVKLTALTSTVVSMASYDPDHAYTYLARELARIADPYDFIFVDTPPENVPLVDLALAAARWLLMPTKSDGGGLKGLKLMSGRFAAARTRNPQLGLLGVVLFASGRNAGAIHRRVRSKVEAAFGGTSPMLTSFIGHSELVAAHARDTGRVPHELESDALTQPAWWEGLRAGAPADSSRGPARIPDTAANVAEDYRQLGMEILAILSNAEKGTA